MQGQDNLGWVFHDVQFCGTSFEYLTPKIYLAILLVDYHTFLWKWGSRILPKINITLFKR